MANNKLYSLNQNQMFSECAIFLDSVGDPRNCPYMKGLTFSWENIHL